ncbi:MAG: 8-oxo-dGTP diphosphatase [Candidatus Dojkabacteria bacterium]|nr:8-oxo-dGTP diphosphatase [Candidatus Dojkabacteria bacterium]
MKETKNLTLCFLIDGDNICLAMKKRGFGANRWNGVGGKVGDKVNGETVEEGLLREVKEEIGVDLKEYDKVGEITFVFIDNPDTELLVHTFVSHQWDGEPTESEEMKPQWFKIDEIPYDDMWSDDRCWLPTVLEGKKIKARFKFDENEEPLENEILEILEF